ncbi:hypothetical protein [Tsuneonella troitsensis]|uniref:hypothetical protein n=1 Tax=Tsuneonella troitsensis TaxID=292222 RepID=UPI00128EDC91|nr:hypothetical protein [Tsuneonella troitsensis]
MSDSDKRAAQLLSLSNNSELDVLEDPQKRATSCIAAIGSLGERLRSAGSLRAEHERAVGVAIDIYRRKALAAGMAPAEVSRAVAESRAEVDDGNQQARMAMACLRQLT